MSKLTTICLIFFFSFQFYKGYTQQSVAYHPSPQNVKVLNANGDTLLYPWAGGHEGPQFSNIDLNNDGVQDLFAFDKTGSTVTTYLNLGNGKYMHAPEYESFFPPLLQWVLLIDYNKDNKTDIFAYSHQGGGIEIYKNVSSGGVLKFHRETELLLYMPEQINVLSTQGDFPTLTDVDGDGDIDILSMNNTQEFITYYKNMSFEEYGNYDSLYFKIWDNCWGKIRESGTSNIPSLGMSCAAIPHKKTMHGGTSLLALDTDGDGDKDILQSDFSSSNFALLENGRIKNGQNAHPIDSIISIDTLYPVTSRPNLPFFLMASSADADNDSRNDLIVTPISPASNTNQVLLYKNTGTQQKPDFNFVKNNFLVDQMIDLGLGAAPAFFDYDSDSLPDLVVATSGDFRQTQHLAARLHLFKNIGTVNKPVFKEINSDFLNVSQLKIPTDIVPAFGDLNGDGKPDLLLGNPLGTLIYYKNTTTAGGNATFALEDEEFGSIDAGDFSAPAIADLNRDGKPDLVVGKKNGLLNYYKNIGTATIPKFKLMTDSFGMVRTSDTWYDYTYNPDNTVKDSTLKWEAVGLSSPVIADINKNGKWDLVSGSKSGFLYIYLDIEDKLLKYFGRDRHNLYSPMLSKYEDKSFGKISHPAIALLNGDSLPDIMIGNDKGGLNLYGSFQLIPAVTDSVPDKMVDTVKVSSISYTEAIPGFKIFPNPATSSLNIAGKAGNVEIRLYNMLGQVLLRNYYRNFSGNEKIDVSGLQKGVYLIRISNEKGRPQLEKIIIE